MTRFRLTTFDVLMFFAKNLPFIAAWTCFYLWLGWVKALVTAVVWTAVCAYEAAWNRVKTIKAKEAARR